MSLHMSVLRRPKFLRFSVKEGQNRLRPSLYVSLSAGLENGETVFRPGLRAGGRSSPGCNTATESAAYRRATIQDYSAGRAHEVVLLNFIVERHPIDLQGAGRLRDVSLHLVEHYLNVLPLDFFE